jgi:hypothetical protein
VDYRGGGVVDYRGGCLGQQLVYPVPHDHTAGVGVAAGAPDEPRVRPQREAVEYNLGRLAHDPLALDHGAFNLSGLGLDQHRVMDRGAYRDSRLGRETGCNPQNLRAVGL